MDAKLLLRVEVPRSIYAQGQIGISSFMLSFLVAGLLFGVMILALLERFVLSRLAALNTSVQSIGAQSNLSERVTMTGDDEIAHLTDSINDMLAALELAQAKHQQAEEVRKRVLIREEALHAKHEFLSIVSHELRTPLTPIAGYVDLMLLGEGGDLTDEQRQFLQTIRSNTTRMASLVEDLLDIGRLETNNITLECRPTDLKVIIAEAAKLLQPELANKQTALVLEFADTLPLVELDPKRIGQVLNNLISNAVKYSYPQATITIRVCPRDNDQIEIQVEDTGVGLTPEQQNQLFTRFYRADNQFRDTVRGSGLGLSIAKSYVELHSGAMSVSSQLSIGSIFMFTLPLRQPQLNDPPLPTQGDQ
jgi:signal transduction histidine kinase